MRDHGGDLARAQAVYGVGDWLDLSTGINPVAYPMPPLPLAALTRLPENRTLMALEQTAQALLRHDRPDLALSGRDKSRHPACAPVAHCPGASAGAGADL